MQVLERGVQPNEAPVAWEHNLRGSVLSFHHRKNRRDEMDRLLGSREPFVVAVAKAKNPDVSPKEHDHFKALCEVVAIRRLSDREIETKVQRWLAVQSPVAIA